MGLVVPFAGLADHPDERVENPRPVREGSRESDAERVDLDVHSVGRRQAGVVYPGAHLPTVVVSVVKELCVGIWKGQTGFERERAGKHSDVVNLHTRSVLEATLCRVVRNAGDVPRGPWVVDPKAVVASLKHRPLELAKQARGDACVLQRFDPCVARGRLHPTRVPHATDLDTKSRYEALDA